MLAFAIALAFWGGFASASIIEPKGGDRRAWFALGFLLPVPVVIAALIAAPRVNALRVVRQM